MTATYQPGYGLNFTGEAIGGVSSQCSDLTNTMWAVPLPHSVLGALLGGSLLVSGVTGNMLLVTSYIKIKAIQTPFNTILLSMSCHNLLYLTLILPVLLSVYVRGQWVPIYTQSGDVDIVCAYLNIFLTHCEIVAFLHVLIVAFYRYAVVVHPLGKLERLNKSRVGVIIMIVLVYMFVLSAWTIPRLHGFTTINRSLGTGLAFTPLFDTRIMLCYTPCIRIFGFLMIIGALSLTVALGVMYARILMVTRRSSRRIRTLPDNKPATSQKREIRFILTVSLLLFICLVCYSGLLVVSSMDVNKVLSHSLYLPFVILNWVPPSCNWLIYTAMTKDFRDAYKKVICYRFFTNNKVQSINTITQMNTSTTNIIREKQIHSLA